MSKRTFGGTLLRVKHASATTNTPMIFALYLPIESLENAQAANSSIPLILYLSGLTCTDENVCQKGYPFPHCFANGLAFLAPDTSPRGAGIEGEDDTWQFGTGAGFYCDATEAPYSSNYNMYSYVVDELLSFVFAEWKVLNESKISIMGHSMGGMGALQIALKNPSRFKSVSCFAPLANPTKTELSRNAFTKYLGIDESTWQQYDPCSIVATSEANYDDILIDVGDKDDFVSDGTLKVENFIEAAKAANKKVTLNIREGYDHAYWFVSSFMKDHIEFHATRL